MNIFLKEGIAWEITGNKPIIEMMTVCGREENEGIGDGFFWQAGDMRLRDDKPCLSVYIQYK